MKELLKKAIAKLNSIVNKPTGPTVEELIADGIKQTATSFSDSYSEKQSLLRSASRHASFAGTDIRLYISDAPFDLTKYTTYETYSTAQSIRWNIGPNDAMANGVVKSINFGSLPPDIEEKYLTVFGVNEYGDYSVIAAFRIEKVTQMNSQTSVDDLFLERNVMWVGEYLRNSVTQTENWSKRSDNDTRN